LEPRNKIPGYFHILRLAHWTVVYLNTAGGTRSITAMATEDMSVAQQTTENVIETAETLAPLSLGNTDYARWTQRLNGVVKMLRQCGTESVISLPKIVAIGNQSSGKSSLIEAISQIELPRASRTCTRCPMELILSRSGGPENWKCKVSLRFEEDELGADKFRTCDFAETQNKEEVTHILRRAQLAILNPNEDKDSFLSLNDEQCKAHRIALSFSRNTVVVEITGAAVDITFIDLPGLIQNTEKVRTFVHDQNFSDQAID
jgi:vacuolar protein sorting-associated protein 1